MRIKGRILILISVFFVFTTSAYASQISFQIIQHDSSQKNVRSASYEIEESLMDYFFDAGYIVTSSPTVVSTSADEDNNAYHKAINDALEGSFDILISIMVEYDVKDSVKSETDSLSNIKKISWSIVNVSDGKVLANNVKSPGVVLPENDNEKGIASFAKLIAKDIDSDIQSIK